MRHSKHLNFTGSSDTSCHSATTMELFPSMMTPTTMHTVYPHHSEVQTIVKQRSMDKEEPKVAQLTIFYAGQVVVFDDFPTNKVEEIMSLAMATKGTSSQSHNSFAYAHSHNQQGNNHPSIVPNITPQEPSTPIVCDMPIARKASLHRFLKKRKDRIACKAPYQTDN